MGKGLIRLQALALTETCSAKNTQVVLDPKPAMGDSTVHSIYLTPLLGMVYSRQVPCIVGSNSPTLPLPLPLISV